MKHFSMLIGLVIGSALAKSDVPGAVFFCPEPDWIGKCAFIKAKLEECQSMIFKNSNTGNEAYNMGSMVSSIGPDKGARCIFYQQIDCQGPFIELAYPGLEQLSPDYNKNVHSWMCYAL